jgi:hypothetical protein
VSQLRVLVALLFALYIFFSPYRFCFLASLFSQDINLDSLYFGVEINEIRDQGSEEDDGAFNSIGSASLASRRRAQI